MHGKIKIRVPMVIVCLMTLSAPFFVGLVTPFNAVATTPHTITIDGSLGDWDADEVMGIDATKTLYLTWDSSTIYLAWDGTDWASEGNLFIYFNTTTGGSYTSVDWDGTHTLPFKADYAFCLKDSTYYDLRAFSNGVWSVVKSVGDITPAPYVGWSDNRVSEIGISLSDLNIGPNSGVDIIVFAQWEDANNVWASFPPNNPASNDGSEVFTHYYHIPALSTGISPKDIEVREKVGGVEPRPDALNLAIVWHMHQPYYKNVLTNKYEMPWVRVHASQEYVDAAKILMRHPGVKVTINVVPTLIEQIEDYAWSNVTDRHTEWVYKGLDNLTDLEKHTMQFEFFWAPSWVWNMPNNASRYYHYLYNKTMHNLTPETIMMDALLPDNELFDLMVLYHLFQISPWYVEGVYNESDRDERILALYDKYGGFTQDDLNYVMNKQIEIMRKVMGMYKEAMQRGQCELTTSPYSHPILPLLLMPGWYNEAGRFIYKDAWYNDTIAQLQIGRDIYKQYFGTYPVGLWPSEESVSQAVIQPVAQCGYKWMISDEMVLKASGVDTDNINNLYRPYIVGDNDSQLYMVFRDRVISDRIAWQYGKMSTSQAVEDFMDYLYNLWVGLDDPPNSLVTVALDGENWMFMSFEQQDNGREFLDALYERLENTDWVRTVSVWDYIQSHPPDPQRDRIDVLARDCPNGAGSWIDGTMSTWSGEEEESLAWERLIAARKEVVKREAENPNDPNLEKAWKSVYAAEGSDWFWWYGLDQDSGYDELWDQLFKTHLTNIYNALNIDLPPYLKNLWLSPEEPVRMATEVIDPGIDGYALPGEWDGAYEYVDSDDSPIAGEWDIQDIWVGYSSRNLYVRIDFSKTDLRYMWNNEDIDLSLYIGSPNAHDMNVYSTNYVTKYSALPLNYPAKWRVKLLLEEALETGRCKYAVYEADGKENWIYKMDKTRDTVAINDVVEWSIPFADLGLEAGDEFRMRVVIANTTTSKDMDVAPPLPMSITIPRDVSPEVVLYELNDTIGDETGDGDYTYPLAQDFAPFHGLWDIVHTQIAATEYDLIFRIKFAELTNVWHLRYGFSHQIIQIYVDTDRVKGSGNLDMLPGANAQVTEDFAWERAISATGDSVFVQMANGDKIATGCEVSGSEDTKSVEIIVSKSLIGNDVTNYGYVIVVGSQDGFGVGKWREVDEEPSVWTLGGGAPPNPEDGKDYDPSVIDMVLPPEEEGNQTKYIGSYDVSAKRYAQLPGITIPELKQQIFGVRVKGITATDAIVTWQTTKPGTSVVEYGTSEGLGMSTEEDTTLDTAHTVVLSGLKPQTKYYFRVGSRDGLEGEFYYSDIMSFNTSAVVDTEPPMILMPVVEVINTTAVEVHFVTDELAKAMVEYWPSNGNGGSTGYEEEFRKSHSFVIDGLIEGETYTYRITAMDASGNTNITANMSFVMGGEGGGGVIEPQKEEVIISIENATATIPAGSFKAIPLEALEDGDHVSISGTVIGVCDIFVMGAEGFKAYNTTVVSKEGYFEYLQVSSMGVSSGFNMAFNISQGDYFLVFDNTPAGDLFTLGNGNVTVTYSIKVTRYRGGVVGNLSATGNDTVIGVYPSRLITANTTLPKDTYGFIKIDANKGWWIYVKAEFTGGRADIIVLTSEEYKRYRIKSSPTSLKYTYLKFASKLDVSGAEYRWLVPYNGTYYIVIDNTPQPKGGAYSKGDIWVSVRVAVDTSMPPLEYDYADAGAGESVEIKVGGEAPSYTEAIVYGGGAIIAILAVLILWTQLQIKKALNTQRKGDDRKGDKNGGEDNGDDGSKGNDNGGDDGE